MFMGGSTVFHLLLAQSRAEQHGNVAGIFRCRIRRVGVIDAAEAVPRLPNDKVKVDGPPQWGHVNRATPAGRNVPGVGSSNQFEAF